MPLELECLDMLNRRDAIVKGYVSNDINNMANLLSKAYLSCCTKYLTFLSMSKSEVISFKNSLESALFSKQNINLPLSTFQDAEELSVYLLDLCKSVPNIITQKLLHLPSLFSGILRDKNGKFAVDSTRLYILYKSLYYLYDHKVTCITLETIKNVYDIFKFVRLSELTLDTKTAKGEITLVTNQIKKSYDSNNVAQEGLTPFWRETSYEAMWNVCPTITKNYFIHFISVPKSKAYVYAPKYLGLVVLYSFLKKVPYGVALKEIEQDKRGLLIHCLDHEKENNLLQSLLSMGYSHFNGRLAKEYQVYIDKLQDTNQKVAGTSLINLWNMEIVPRMQAIMAEATRCINEELNTRADIYKANTEICYINPYCVVLRIYGGIKLQRILPLNSHYFKEVTTGNLDSLLFNSL